jgi:1-acyl-sn-glycerol-3-phosphate acyltransferase
MLPAFWVREALAPPAQRETVRGRWVFGWSSVLLRLFGLSVVTTGQSRACGRGRLVVANHRSTADILLLLRAFRGTVVSRADLARWPLFGAAARSVGTLFVERADAVSGATAVRAIQSRLAEGATVIVFPEGTTFAEDRVRPFRSGAFVAALRSGASVVPVGLAYASGSGAAFVNESFTSHLLRMAGAPPSRVAMCIGEDIQTDAGATAALLRERTHAEVQQLVAEARRIVDAR